jgi:hypothetical protein
MDVSIYCTGQESVSYLVLVTVMDVSIYCTGQESVGLFKL